MNSFTVLVDACVFYPAPLRDLIMRLAAADLFRAKWTNKIHDEWIENLLANRPDLDRNRLYRTRDLMNAEVRDCLVEGYQAIESSLILPDHNDRHVLAAAILVKADLILTRNLKDFPEEALAPFNIEVQHPDPFLLNQFDLDQAKVLTVLKEQRESLKNPPVKSLEFLETLERQQLPLFVAELKKFADVI